jgi:ABC-type bacteriocin/lantibiotic exporter with double-glycine peptidase domain
MGFLIATLLLQIREIQNLLTDPVYRYIFIAIVALLFGIAIFFAQKILMIIATGIIGAYAITLGADYWIKSGFGRFGLES